MVNQITLVITQIIDFQHEPMQYEYFECLAAIDIKYRLIARDISLFLFIQQSTILDTGIIFIMI